MVTHVFNAMPALDHRAPGLLAVALVDTRVHVSLIADGIHVHPLALELVRATKGPRAVLVTDATPKTAQPLSSDRLRPHRSATTPPMTSVADDKMV